MKIRYFLFSALFVFAFMYGCSTNESVALPDLGTSSDKLNQDLDISLFPTFNTFKIGESVSLEIRLKSDLEVRSTENFNARLFVFSPDDSQWKEVEEVPDLGIFEPYEIVLTKKEGGFDETSITVFPKLQSQGKTVQLLIFITGNIYKDGQDTGQTTSAYTIVSLKP